MVTLATTHWAAAAISEAAAKPSLQPDRLDSYIAIEKDGTVTAYYGKIDGGQGLETSIAQMVAEEFDVSLDRVHVVMGDTGRTVNMGGASAATGVSRAGMISARWRRKRVASCSRWPATGLAFRPSG